MEQLTSISIESLQQTGSVIGQAAVGAYDRMPDPKLPITFLDQEEVVAALRWQASRILPDILGPDEDYSDAHINYLHERMEVDAAIIDQMVGDIVGTSRLSEDI